MSAVVVLIETDDGRIDLVSREALTVAGVLGSEVHAVVLGTVDEAIMADAADHGVAVVHEATDAELSRYAAAAWARAVDTCAAATEAAIVIGGGTPHGMEVLAHVAARRRVPMAANVVDITSMEPLEVERQVAGGAVLERRRLTASPAVFTIAGHAFDAEPDDAPAATQRRPFVVGLAAEDLRAQVSAVEADAGGDGAELANARIVIGVGRGAGGPNGFSDADRLAARLGGVVGVSRVVTGNGWRPHHEQVGQSGTRIAPDVYLACGISGAAQHLAGCSAAKTVIAINTDANAPMVAKADYAVIGDMHEVLPALLEALE